MNQVAAARLVLAALRKMGDPDATRVGMQLVREATQREKSHK